MHTVIDLTNLIEFDGRELRSRIYRDSIEEIIKIWDAEGEGDFQKFLLHMFQIKWNEYIISN